MRSRPLLALAAIAFAGCESKLDEQAFQRQAEKAYSEVNPGFGMMRRQADKSWLVRGDQVYELDTAALFKAYQASGKGAGAWFNGWRERIEAEAKARRRSLDAAKDEILPIIKSGAWIRAQDLGAIGPLRVQEKIRPWRKDIAQDVFVLVGVPEELLGYRYVSAEEMTGSPTTADEWLGRAVANLATKVGTSTGTELRGDDDRLLVYSIVEVDGASALVLDRGFREKMLRQFGQDELGAALPNRDVIIVFVNEFTTVKPIRFRTYELYDGRNHPAFRGLLLFDRNSVSVLEPATPRETKAP